MGTLTEHGQGTALGTFAGDALGQPVEGLPAFVLAKYGPITEMTGELRGCYTDDTQMMIGILETLAECGQFDPAVCARHWAENYEPHRGYGGRIHDLMARLRAGEPWDQVGTDSWGNGGAMRVAPIGFFYHADLAQLKEMALRSAHITHQHPRGLAGAVAQAAAVGLATRHGREGTAIDRDEFVTQLVDLVRDVDTDTADYLEKLRSLEAGEVLDNVVSIVEVYLCDVSALEAVPPAIAAFLLTDNFRDAVVTAVNCGGDTDTLGAMAGAIAGAYYGVGAIPEPWLDALENEGKGRDYVRDLATKVAELCVMRRT